MKKKTKEEFIEESTKVHNGKYDYSKVDYINNKTKVCIVCPIHGEFWQAPQDHTKGRGCTKCNGGVLHSNEEWLDKFKRTHGEKYIYSIDSTKKLTSNTKLNIVCPIHGTFMQACINHSTGQGCPKCANENNSIVKRKNNEYFISIAEKIHGNKYDYSKVDYINNHTEVCIICPKHGEFWQKPNVHLLNHGCPKCSCSKLELEIIKLLDDNKIEYIHQANKKDFPWLKRLSLDFYLPEYNIAIECQGIEHFKEIKFFGGTKKYIETVKRDNRKLNLCENNNIKLLYYSNLEIKYPYKVYENKEELLKEIINEKQSSNFNGS